MSPESGGVAILEPHHNRGYFELIAEQSVGKTQFGSFVIQVPPAGRRLEGLLGYRRCFDFDLTDGAGQDYAVLRVDSQHAVGVVADGVSQSFFGNLAAIHLSSFLVQYLWGQRQMPPRKQDVEGELKRLEKSVAEVVRQHDIPERIPPMQRVALEKGRAKGSQAVFGAFILDNRNQSLQVYQSGDVRAIVHRAGQPPTTVSADPRGRWSTGGVSDLMLESLSYSNVEEVIVASDGVPAGWNDELRTGSSSSDSFQEMAAEQAAKDDVSFVAVRFTSGAPVGQADEKPARSFVRPDEKPASSVVWVDGADSVAPPRPPQQVKPPREKTDAIGTRVPANARPEAKPGRDLPAPPVRRGGNGWLRKSSGALLIFCLGFVSGLAVVYPPSKPGIIVPKIPKVPPADGSSVHIRTAEISHYDLMREFLDTVQPISQAAMIRITFHDLEGYQVKFSSSVKGVAVPGPIEVQRAPGTSRASSTVVYVKGLPETGKASIVTIDVGDRNGLVASAELSVEANRVYAVNVQKATP